MTNIRVQSVTPSKIVRPRTRPEELDNWLATNHAAQLMLESAHENYPDVPFTTILRNIFQYDSWGEMIPATFGVSHEEFEKQWNDYVRASLGERDESDLQ